MITIFVQTLVKKCPVDHKQATTPDTDIICKTYYIDIRIGICSVESDFLYLKDFIYPHSVH